jgi:four helix bundle protein
MKDFRNLQVWEKAHKLTLSLYRATQSFPKEEVYGITSQLRRASSSIPTNIAEGCGRGSDAELGRFLQIAMGSASEVEYLALLVNDLGYLNSSIYQLVANDIVEVKKMLVAFIKKTPSKPVKA